MKDDFVSTVSHELRTPLTSIRAFAEMLFDRPDTPPERRQQFLGIILKETERLTRLIDQILDLAKIESGRARVAHRGARPARAGARCRSRDQPAVRRQGHCARDAAARAACPPSSPTATASSRCC